MILSKNRKTKKYPIVGIHRSQNSVDHELSSFVKQKKKDGLILD